MLCQRHFDNFHDIFDPALVDRDDYEYEDYDEYEGEDGDDDDAGGDEEKDDEHEEGAGMNEDEGTFSDRCCEHNGSNRGNGSRWRG